MVLVGLLLMLCRPFSYLLSHLIATITRRLAGWVNTSILQTIGERKNGLPKLLVAREWEGRDQILVFLSQVYSFSCCTIIILGVKHGLLENKKPTELNVLTSTFHLLP